MEVDNNNHIPGDVPSFHHNLSQRNNYDNQINDHGKILLDTCKSCNLRILNGRTKGDSIGKITYHLPIRISTVYYIIVSDDFTNSIENLTVKQPTIFSDHSQIVCWINIPPTTPIHAETMPTEMLNLPKQFIWQRNSNETFLTHLNLTNINHDCQLLRKRNSTLPARESTLQLSNSLIYKMKYLYNHWNLMDQKNAIKRNIQKDGSIMNVSLQERF